MNNNSSTTTISNIKVTEYCYKRLKMLALDRDKKLQEVCSELLEKAIKTETISEIKK